MPRSILYDNTRLAVARILGDDWRKRTRVFSELVSHYLFEERFGRRNTRPYAARRAILWGRPGVQYPSNGARPPPTPPARAKADPATRATPLPAGPLSQPRPGLGPVQTLDVLDEGEDAAATTLADPRSTP